MLAISEAAVKQLDEYFADKEKAQIRVYLSAGGCSGPRLALALDEATDDDQLLSSSGYEFVIEKELLSKAAPLSIDITGMGFNIESSLELGGGGGCGCSGSCSSGSCSPGSCG